MNEPFNEIQRLVVDAITDKKGFDVLVLDLRNRSELTDCFILCSGNTRVQVQAIVDSILDKTVGTPYKSVGMEGYSAGNWVIIDLVEVMVHVFQKDVRKHYDLERLWGDAPVIGALA